MSQQPRYGHTATLLPSGMVLIAGGANNSEVVNIAEYYNLSSQLFISHDGAGNYLGVMSARRQWHTATLLPNNQVLLTGGYCGPGDVTDSAEIYDPATLTFSLTGDMCCARRDHTATLLSDGRVLIAGGQTSAYEALEDAEAYH